MKQRTALDITAIIGAVLALLQFLPQLLKLIQPILDLLPHQGAVGAGAGVWAATWAAFRGYQWLKEPATATGVDLQTDLAAMAELKSHLATIGTPEALQTLATIATAEGQYAAAVSAKLQQEAAEPKSPMTTQVDEFLATFDAVAEASKRVQAKAKELAPKE